MSNFKKVQIFSNAELSVPDLIRLVREYAAMVAKARGLEPSDWHDYLIDLVRDLNVIFVNACGQHVDLPIHVLGVSDHEIDIGNAKRVEERINEWFGGIVKPIPAHVTPYVRREARERFVVLASLLIAAYPEETANWPRIIVANDNMPAPKAINDNWLESEEEVDES